LETSPGGKYVAYEYDRFEREDGGGSFLMGLLAGTVLGAGLGMLFAPKPGSEVRAKLSEQAGKLRTTAADGYQQATGKVTQIVDRGREAYDRARSSAGAAVESAADAVKIATAATGTDGDAAKLPGAPGATRF
jgi:gas vesicle protein